MAKYAIGIDLGGTNIKAGLVDENYKILAESSIPTLVTRPVEAIINDMMLQIVGLTASYPAPQNDIVGIGIGSPGIIDSEKGTVIYSNNFNWKNVPLKGLIEQRTMYKVAITNDANAAALGEVAAGTGRNYRNAIVLTLGTGVGSGIILNGKIFDGCNLGGSEFGHTTLISGGEECTCGRKGCVEAYVSATALIREGRKAMEANPDSMLKKMSDANGGNLDPKMIFDAANQKDPAAAKIVEEYIMHLGDAIVNAINLFRPDIVLLGGGVCNQGNALTIPLNAYVRKHCFGGDKAFIPPIGIAQLDNHAGIIGGAALAFSTLNAPSWF